MRYQVTTRVPSAYVVAKFAVTVGLEEVIVTEGRGSRWTRRWLLDFPGRMLIAYSPAGRPEIVPLTVMIPEENTAGPVDPPPVLVLPPPSNQKRGT